METPKTLGNQEGVVNKKAKIIEHVRQKLERAKKRLAELDEMEARLPKTMK